MTLYDELVARGLIAQVTDEEEIKELINNGTCKLKSVIGCRDNIMTDLIHWGVKEEVAFSTMETVRKGKGIAWMWLVP